MREFMASWYSILNTLFVALKEPLGGLASDTGASLIAAMLLGILGAASPCQLSTNASSIAYLLGGAGRRGRAILGSAAAYMAGKVLVYSGIGLLAVLMGEGLQAIAIPAAVATRKALGPLMILIGLAMLGVWQPRWAIGQGLSWRLRERAANGGALGAFLLGVAFAFAFCPTLALLFFGYVIPSAVTSAAGPVYPAVFALGTMFPLIVAAAVVTSSADTSAFTGRLASWEPRLRRIAGGIFLLAGLNDTLLYWYL